jgi:hypothetical protein
LLVRAVLRSGLTSFGVLPLAGSAAAAMMPWLLLHDGRSRLLFDSVVLRAAVPQMRL